MASPYDTVLPGPGNFVSRAFHASAVLRDWLYIDGGELTYNTADTQNQELFNQTIAIDLGKDWTNSSVQMHTIERGSAPLLNNMAWWPNLEEDALYNFGGALSYWASSKAKLVPQAPEQWKFTPDRKGGGEWAKEEADASFPAISPNAGAHTFGNATGYYLGGELDSGTYPAQAYNSGYGVPGLIELDTSSNTWQNLTSSSVSQDGTASNGGAHFVPTFGPEGLAVFFGSTQPVPDNSANATVREPFSTISVFEPQSKKWFNQTASGPAVPDWRTNFCATGVAGDNGTYEIYIHGGTKYIHTGALYWASAGPLVANETRLDTIYALSLPSFTWHQVPYEPVSSRYQHTCHIPTVNSGNSQMLIVGGLNFETVTLRQYDQDNFTQGLGVFDLNGLTWSSSWKAEAQPYKTPQKIKDYIAAHGNQPSQWNSSQLESAFQISRKASTGPAKKESSITNGQRAAAIIGLVGVILFFCGFALWCVLRRRRARRRQRVEAAKLHEPNGYFTRSELGNPGNVYEMGSVERKIHELSTNQVVELDSTTKPVELHGEGRTF